MDVKVEGFEELFKDLRSLEPRIAKRIAGKAVRAGANVVRDAARDKAPIRTNSWEGINYPNKPGTLKKNIRVNRLGRQPRGIVRDIIGFSKKAWYGVLVERGHDIVVGGKKNKGGKVIKHVPPHPILRPAFDNNVAKVMAAIKRVAAIEIEKMK